jgi:hypothetical protein
MKSDLIRECNLADAAQWNNAAPSVEWELASQDPSPRRCPGVEKKCFIRSEPTAEPTVGVRTAGVDC